MTSHFKAIRLAVGVLFGLALASPAYAQTPTVTFSTSSANPASGAPVSVSVSVSGFNRVNSADFTVEWSPSVLQFASVGNFNLTGLSSGNLGTTLAASDGKLTMTWDDQGAASGVTVPDGTTIFTIQFNAIGANGTSTTVAFGDNPNPREVYADLAPANFGSNPGTVTVGVLQTTPTITWSNPADITYGTSLGAAQLNASASVPGTFTYSPPAGTVLSAGNGQTLSVTFVPNDTVNYSNASGSVLINVNRAPLTARAEDKVREYGAANPPLTINYSGFVNNDNASVVNAPEISTTATAGSNAGSYPITLSGGSAANYVLNLVPGTLTVTRATPVITWSNPADIAAGTALSGAQLNASASVAGTFTYNPPAGTVMNGGNGQILSVSFAPTDTANYNNAFASVLINVGGATPTITWSNPADITYGTALGAAQLNASASVPGTFTYTPAAGTVLNAGNGQTLSVTFVPTDTASYTTASSSVLINVNKAPLTARADDKTRAFGDASPPLTISYSGFVNNDNAGVVTAPTASTTATAGSSVGSYPITLSGGSAANYALNLVPGTLTVTKATPAITWSNPADIAAGTALSGAQLNASASVAGTFTYSPAAGTVLNPGNGQILSVSFVPTDTANYNNASATVQINVTKATPTITWSNPADITYGTPLGAAQLNASASVPGTFTYSPPAGTVLNAGNGQTLSVTFVPSDTATYSNASRNVQINVNKAPLTARADDKTREFGAANPPLTISYSGFVNNDTAGVVTAPTASTTATAGSSVGTYPITLSGGSAANYVLNLVPGTLTVNRAGTPTITWSNPADIVYGTALSGVQLNATASVVGTFTYTPAAGTVLNAGNGQTLAVAFVPTDTANHSSASATVLINVTKATPLITWTNPAAIIYGTALSSAQLNASASVAGTFTYTPPAGTVLSAGNGQTLSASFVPADAANYNQASATTRVDVVKANLTVLVNNATRAEGAANPVFTGVINGVRNNDNISAAYSSSATSDSPVGVYPITAVLADPDGRLGNYIVGITNGTLTVVSNARIFHGIAHDGYITGGVVFLDLDGDLTLDAGEPATDTNDRGEFQLAVDVSRFDANRNGQLEPAEGRLVVVGGIDLATGHPLRTVLLAPFGSTVINPLTTLLSAAIEGNPALTRAEAETRLKTALGLPSWLVLTRYDAFAAAQTGDTNAPAILEAGALAQDTIVQVSALLNGVLERTNTAAANIVTRVLANNLVANVAFDLTGTNSIQNLIQQSASLAGANLAGSVPEAAAQIIAATSAAKEDTFVLGRSAMEIVSEINRVQGVAQGIVADSLTGMGAGTVSVASALAYHTGAALQQSILLASLGDVWTGDTRPGTLLFDQAAYRVGEDGTGFPQVTIIRMNGNKGPLEALIRLADGSATSGSGDYTNQVITVSFQDREISQTVDLSAIVLDDAGAEPDETIRLTLALGNNAPAEAALGATTNAIVTITDNELVAPPKLERLRVLADRSVTLSLTGQAGRGYVVEASTNLVSWSEVSRGIILNGQIEVRDSAAPSFGRRFYRATSQ